MKEITFVYPKSKITRAIKVCETQNELINVIRERRIFNDGSIFVLYNDGSYFFQLLGSDGYKAGLFKRCGIKAATVSSFSGELFVFGDFAITPDGLVCIGEENIKKYGSYSGQYDVKPKKVETKTETKTETNTKTKTETKTKITITKTTINMEHFEDDMNYFMEHFDDEYGYYLFTWD